MLNINVVILIFFIKFSISNSSDLDESISWPLRNGLPLASTITIKGKTGSDNDEDKVFAIDLKEDVTCAKGLWKADTMFHMSVRYGEGYIVFNSYSQDQYKVEERHYDMPIRTNSDFSIKITVLSDKFEIVINGKETYDFKHRVSYSRIKRLIVRRNVYVSAVIYN